MNRSWGLLDDSNARGQRQAKVGGLAGPDEVLGNALKTSAALPLLLQRNVCCLYLKEVAAA